MPLRNLGPTEDEYFAAGITDEIISRLATVRGLGVLSSGSTAKFQASGSKCDLDFRPSSRCELEAKHDGSSRSYSLSGYGNSRPTIWLASS